VAHVRRRARGRLAGARELEHFQEKWVPVFRPKMRQCENAAIDPQPFHPLSMTAFEQTKRGDE
jgi:hypothetical protein